MSRTYKTDACGLATFELNNSSVKEIEYKTSINSNEYFNFRIHLNQVLAAVLGVQVPGRILRVQGQNQKLRMCGRTSYTVQSATLPVLVRQM